MTITYTEGVGGKRMLRLARGWTGGDVVAAALIRRADVVVKHVSPVFADQTVFQGRPPRLRVPAGHAAGARRSRHAAPRRHGRARARPPARDAAPLAAGTATPVVGEGRGLFRPLAITDGSDTVTVAAPFMGAAQKAALALIERVTA